MGWMHRGMFILHNENHSLAPDGVAEWLDFRYLLLLGVKVHH